MTTPPEPTTRWRSLWSRPSVPLGPVLVAILIVVVGFIGGFLRLEDIREDAARAACESSNEFRMFFGSYLTSQIGVPISEAPGFEQLTPEQQQFASSFAPIFDAGSEARAAYAAQYQLDFPVRDCG